MPQRFVVWVVLLAAHDCVSMEDLWESQELQLAQVKSELSSITAAQSDDAAAVAPADVCNASLFGNFSRIFPRPVLLDVFPMRNLTSSTCRRCCCCAHHSSPF
jgi:hypothetical protein